MNQENKNAKFDPNLLVAVELSFDKPKSGISQYKNEDGSDKNWYLYGIKRTITGENGFFATPILHDIIKNMGAKEGTKLNITKVVKDEKTSWKVDVVGGDVKAPVAEKPIQEVSIDDVPKVIEEVKTGMTLEQKVNILWSEYEKKNPKTVSDDLPF